MASDFELAKKVKDFETENGRKPNSLDELTIEPEISEVDKWLQESSSPEFKEALPMGVSKSAEETSLAQDMAQGMQAASANVAQDAKNLIQSKGMNNIMPQTVQAMPQGQTQIEQSMQEPTQQQTSQQTQPSQAQAISPEQAREQDVMAQFEAIQRKQEVDAVDRLNIEEARLIQKESEYDSEIQKARESQKGANIFSSGSTFQKILAGLSLTMGVLGGNTKDVISILNKREDDIIKQNQDVVDKYTSLLGDVNKAKIAVKQDYYDTLDKILEEKKQFANPVNRMKMEQIQADVLLKRTQIGEFVRDQVQKSKMASGKVTEEMVPNLPKEDKERIVRDKNGNLLGLADSKEKAQKLTEQIDTIAPSIIGIEKLESFAKQGNIYDPRKRAEVDTVIGTIIGALRLPITGPGILTDSERKMLKSLIGNPNSFFSLESSNLKRLNTIKEFLESTIKIKMRTSGVDKRAESNTFRRKN